MKENERITNDVYRFEWILFTQVSSYGERAREKGRLWFFAVEVFGVQFTVYMHFEIHIQIRITKYGVLLLLLSANPGINDVVTGGICMEKFMCTYVVTKHEARSTKHQAKF